MHGLALVTPRTLSASKQKPRAINWSSVMRRIKGDINPWLVLALSPIVLPLFAVGFMAALIAISVVGGFKNGESFFMKKLAGMETNEEMTNRVIREKNGG